MRWLSCSALLAGALLGWCAARNAVAADAAHPVVPAFERLHGQGEQPEVGGQLLVGELSCISCHAADDKSQAYFHNKPAPILDNVGGRVRPEYIQQFLANPHETKPGTSMPDPFVGWNDGEKKEAVEALTHYLALTGAVADQQLQPASVGKGEALYHSLGCVACHDAQKAESEKLPTSVPLGNLGAKYTLPALAAFLQDPSKSRHQSRMPAMNLEGDEARSLASYLLRDLKGIQTPANLKYAIYNGSFTTLPDFAKIKPDATGETSGFELSFVPTKDNFALRLQGTLNIPNNGDYRFHLASDDGSRLFIDGVQVVNNDGIHGKVSKDGAAKLKAGLHAIIVDFFEAAGGEELEVLIEGPGLDKQPLENLLVTEKKPDVKEKPKFIADPSLAAKGKELFASVGCASCHQMQSGGERMASKIEAPALASLKTNGGCLSAEPIKGVPNFNLSGAQRKALAAGVESLKKPLPELSAEDKIVRVAKALNCIACHARGDIGGIEELRNPHFQTTQKEMGDEGRIPPPLTGVGAKLKQTALKQQLEVSPKERPYMLTRMPRFAGFPFAELIAALDKDEAPPLKKVEHKFAEREMKHAGYTLVGAKGYSCIKCHTWGGVQATGIQSINMQRMEVRLKQEWFEAYLLNPQAFRPGTRMPAAWPEGQVLLPKILDGKAETQIRSLWVYLADGVGARIPLGLGRDPIELVAETEAIMYRNFIEGGGPRAIGVAYPEKINLAYDANNMRLAMIWQGSFIDASKHWVDRGQGFQGPLGENIVQFPSGVPFATLADAKTPWPSQQPAKELGYQFKGYTFDKLRRPTFAYKYGDISVTEEILPAGPPDKPTFRRTITLKSTKVGDNIYFRAAVDDSIRADESGVYMLKDNLQMKLSGGGKPIVRQDGGKAELLVPVTFADGEAKIVQELIW